MDCDANCENIHSRHGAVQVWCPQAGPRFTPHWASRKVKWLSALAGCIATMLHCYIATLLHYFCATLLLCYIATLRYITRLCAKWQNTHCATKLHTRYFKDSRTVNKEESQIAVMWFHTKGTEEHCSKTNTMTLYNVQEQRPTSHCSTRIRISKNQHSWQK